MVRGLAGQLQFHRCRCSFRPDLRHSPTAQQQTEWSRRAFFPLSLPSSHFPFPFLYFIYFIFSSTHPHFCWPSFPLWTWLNFPFWTSLLDFPSGLPFWICLLDFPFWILLAALWPICHRPETICHQFVSLPPPRGGPASLHKGPARWVIDDRPMTSGGLRRANRVWGMARAGDERTAARKYKEKRKARKEEGASRKRKVPGKV